MTDELRALNARFIHNFITNDVPSHDAILQRSSSASRRWAAGSSRADYLKAWATGFDAERIPYYDYRDEKIDVFGDTALVRSTNKSMRHEGRRRDRRHDHVHRHLCAEGGAWKCVQAQITPVAPANYPPDKPSCGNTSRAKPKPERSCYGWLPDSGRPP